MLHLPLFPYPIPLNLLVSYSFHNDMSTGRRERERLPKSVVRLQGIQGDKHSEWPN